MWKLLVGAFNQENALEAAFSIIVKPDGSFAALMVTLLLDGSLYNWPNLI